MPSVKIDPAIREHLASLIDELAAIPLWASRTDARLALVAAAKLVRRGRHLTFEEKLARLEAFLNEPDDQPAVSEASPT